MVNIQLIYIVKANSMRELSASADETSPCSNFRIGILKENAFEFNTNEH